MPKILLLSHKSEYFHRLLAYLNAMHVEVTVNEPSPSLSFEGFDGVILSGGSLPKGSYRNVLSWYSSVIPKLDIPVLGICLGLKILGSCYNARIRKLEVDEHGLKNVEFFKEFTLVPGRKRLSVYEDHSFELIGLQYPLENYGSSDLSKVKAIKHVDKPQFAVQFHPEVIDGNEGHEVLDGFIKFCQGNL